VFVITQQFGWNLTNRPIRRNFTHTDYVSVMEGARAVLPWSAAANGLQEAVTASYRVVLEHSALMNFSRWFVYSVFLGFLMPFWSLSFATHAFGVERENRSLIWLTTRPVPRGSIYLAKLAGLLPWTLGLNLLGFGLICWAAGPTGAKAFAMYWPAVLGGSLAYSALFHLIGATFRRPAVVALVYVFFVETIVGDLPGSVKKCSISYYTRCLLYQSAEEQGISPERSLAFVPVGGTTAWLVLIGVTLVLTALGMAWFARSENGDAG
jgi:hypothetical protein